MTTQPSNADRIAGSLVGLAIGDALGFPHEFRGVEQVRAEIGPDGIREFISAQDERFTRPFFVGAVHPPGTFTDDTQMTIALAEGLLDVDPDASIDEQMVAIGRRFVTWCNADDNDRAPGGTCMTGCRNLERGAPWRDAGVADSKGCGSAMRVAPIGLVYDDLDRVEAIARASSLLTHGHDAGVAGAAAAALLVALARAGASPQEMFDEVDARCSPASADFSACFRRVPTLLDADPDVVLAKGGLGESWVAEEAVASALWCYWRHPDDYEACVITAINTEGDSDSIGCIAGSISGAALGVDAIPLRWIEGVEDSDGLFALARRLSARAEGG